ncbi:MAG: hypothetical protein KJZ59_05880 [Pararhodobacter sp.]|nr:hypothetical protein [Pararhodobacter sp.]
MKAQPSTFSRFGNAMKLPFSFFADEKDRHHSGGTDRVSMRFDDLQRSMAETLPEKRFFKH